MDASKLRNSCICGNTLPYLECCGRYSDPPSPKLVHPTPPGDVPHLQVQAASELPLPARSPDSWLALEAVNQAERDNLYYDFRHGMHELSMALFPLRSLYQAYWEKLSKEEYPHDLLMEDPDYGRAVVEDFFWDFFLQYSDARPILRTARELEGKQLRLAHDLMKWSFAPLWFYRVEARSDREAILRNLGNGKEHKVWHPDRLPEAGAGVITRLLPYRGREFCGHAILSFDPAYPESRLEALFRGACRELKVKPTVTLRPDVHCEEWRKHGSVFLALWRGEAYDAKVGRPLRDAELPPPLTLAIRDRAALEADLAAAAHEAKPTGQGRWDIRYRSLKVARLEVKGGALAVTVTHAAFRDHAREWLQGHLAASVALPSGQPSGTKTTKPPGSGTTENGNGGGERLPDRDAADLDAWIHTPLPSLNGQTPIQSSAHDLGRMRLKGMLKEMAKQGRDVTSLRRQLGL